MKYISRRKIAFLFVLGTIMAALGAGLWIRNWYWQATDLSVVPPAQSFTRVLGMPVPAGVSELNIAGTAYLSGEVWMRFKVADADAFLNALRRHGFVLETAYELRIRPEGIRNSRYAAIVEWEDALRVARPRYYRFHREPLGMGWAGELLIDLQQKTIYLHGDLL